MKLKLYNSLTKNIEDFTPINEDIVKIYSCGPTVYSYAHIGNMRSFLFADLLQRTLKTVGQYEVKWVMNITNIDDKTIRDIQPGSNAWLKEFGKQSSLPIENLLTLTNYYLKAFIEDIKKLKIQQADFYKIPKATDYIAQMQTLIIAIMKKNLAYIASGSIYFNVAEYRKAEVYGKLFKIDFDNFQSGTRVDTDQYEREQVSDFVLWKCQKPGEPYWDFNIDGMNYPGRPGWHIECSAMEKELLGLPFDIHTGGIDLKFPHHEDEIAQSKAGYGLEPTNYWCHNEFLEIEGSKMSKSAGNFYTLRDLETGVDGKSLEPIDIRYAMLSVHYRTKYNFTFSGIAASRKARLRIQDYIFSLKPENYDRASKKAIISENILTLQNAVFKELANDLHTPKALAHLFTFINNNTVDSLKEQELVDFLSFMYDIDDIFQCWEFECKVSLEDTFYVPDNVNQLAIRRLAAKNAKDFQLADQLRKEINAFGYNIVDTPGSFKLEKKL